MYYGARYYDWVLGRFISADTIVPNQFNPQSLNRYSYVLNNPLKYTDPTGHMQACADGDIGGGCGLPGIYVPPEPSEPPDSDLQKEKTAKAAANTAALLNLFAFDVSVAGLVVVGTTTSAGTALQPGGGTTVGLATGLLSYQFFNVVENALGVASTGLTIYADSLLGNTYIDPSTGGFSLGQDTVASVTGTILGLLSNEPITDTIINGASAGYSFGSVLDTVPKFGPIKGVLPFK